MDRTDFEQLLDREKEERASLLKIQEERFAAERARLEAEMNRLRMAHDEVGI